MVSPQVKMIPNKHKYQKTQLRRQKSQTGRFSTFRKSRKREGDEAKPARPRDQEPDRGAKQGRLHQRRLQIRKGKRICALPLKLAVANHPDQQDYMFKRS